MATRRKSQARRGSERRVPIWIWLLGGMLIGLGLSAALLIYDRDGRLPGPRPNPAAQAPRESEAPIAPAPRAEPEKQKPRYDFYTLLRERETQVSDKELAEKVRAETARPAAPA
ncbi:MAG TPA: sporulation protein, partial [Chiayiivirga sp.]|nr:sporulation protein [Chiayiivirga sp.]